MKNSKSKPVPPFIDVKDPIVARNVAFFLAGAVLCIGMSLSGCSEAGIQSTPVENTSNIAVIDVPKTSLVEQYIVVLKSSAVGIQSTAQNVVNSVLTDNAVKLDVVNQRYTSALLGFAGSLTPSQLQSLRRDPRVASIEKDQVWQLDNKLNSFSGNTNSSSGKGAEIQAQSTPWGIAAVGGFLAVTSTTKTGWIIDTGIELTHPDLNIDAARSKSFVSNQTSATDGHGHGTHVAGIMAAKNNSVGVVGVCAGARVVAVRVLDANGSGTTSAVLAGVDYVRQKAVAGDVVNLSLGGGLSTTLDNAIINLGKAGVYVACAAGNNSVSAVNSSPGRANGLNIFTVSAHDSRNVFASFSNYGNPPIDWCAPGVSILSCYKGGQYATMSGTSMACPHVAGILLSSSGKIWSRGTVTGDKDATPDLLAFR